MLRQRLATRLGHGVEAPADGPPAIPLVRFAEYRIAMSGERGAEVYDAAIVGGGPAGLAAAIAVSRMNRRAICFETGTPRTAHAPRYHNIVGFPEGISGLSLLARGREQAEKWGATLVEAAVTVVEQAEAGRSRFVVRCAERSWRAGGIVFATGVVDRQLDCGNLYGETDSGVHYCVVCDGYETRGERVAVVGRGRHAVEMVGALRDFTADLHLLLESGAETLPADDRRQLEAWGVAIHPGPIRGYRCDGRGTRFETTEELASFPHVFVALGVEPQTEVAYRLGCTLDDDRYIVTDEHQATSVPFVYAAGDCDGGHKQVTQAMAEGERAALDLVGRMRAAVADGPGLATS